MFLANDTFGIPDVDTVAESIYPPAFVCPIARTLMVDPMLALCGHAFDRPAIEWLLTSVGGGRALVTARTNPSNLGYIRAQLSLVSRTTHTSVQSVVHPSLKKMYGVTWRWALDKHTLHAT